MTMNSVLILGATSDVGKALALQYHKKGFELLLAARNTIEVESFLASWSDNQNTQVVSFEATDFLNHQEWVNRLTRLPSITICLFGYLGDHNKALTNWKETHQIIDSNYTGAVSILNVIANAYEGRKEGVIVGVSSVAGERGRQSNYFYGSAKAGFTTYLSGLRNRLAKTGVHVLTVKPGFINTRMTAQLNLPKLLTATANQVATQIIRAVGAKRNTIYVLSVWFWIMVIIRLIPEFIFKKLKL